MKFTFQHLPLLDVVVNIACAPLLPGAVVGSSNMKLVNTYTSQLSSCILNTLCISPSTLHLTLYFAIMHHAHVLHAGRGVAHPSTFLARMCLHACTPGVISLNAMGLGVSEDAADEAQAAASQATGMLDVLFPAVLSAFRCAWVAWGHGRHGPVHVSKWQRPACGAHASLQLPPMHTQV